MIGNTAIKRIWEMIGLDSKKFRLLNDSTFPINSEFLRTGIFSLLVHFLLIVFLTLGLIPKHTKGGSVVYRVTLQTIPPQSDSTFQTPPLPIPAKPQIQKAESRWKQEIEKKEDVFEKENLESEIRPPPQTVTPEIPLEEQKQPPRPQEREQTPIPLPLGEPSISDKGLNIKVEDNFPVQFSLSHLGEESRNTNSSAGSGEQLGQGGPSGVGSGDGSGLGRGGLGRGGSGNGSGQGILGWTGSGAGAGIGQGGPGGFGSGGSENGSGTGQGGSGGRRVGDYGTGMTYPRHAENPKPIYPVEAREKGYKGEVLLKIEVLSNGRVGQIEVKKSSGHEVLDQSALSTVKKWKFIPAQKGGVSIPFWVNIPVKFELQ